MAEYISRESVEKYIEAGLNNPDKAKAFGYDAIEILAEVHYMPAADAVPVVRCKDCKHAWIHPCGYVYCHRDGRNAYEMTFNLDSFCSYGERR